MSICTVHIIVAVCSILDDELLVYVAQWSVQGRIVKTLPPRREKFGLFLNWAVAKTANCTSPSSKMLSFKMTEYKNHECEKSELQSCEFPLQRIKKDLYAI